MQTINDLLLWLTSGLGATAVVSFALAFWGRFTDFPERTQFLIRAVLMIAIVIAAQFGINAIPEDTKAALSPYVKGAVAALSGLFVVYKAGNQGNDTNVNAIRSRAIKRGQPFERPTKF